MRVQRAYAGDRRVLVSDEGQVYLPEFKRWVAAGSEVIRLPEVYSRWHDVPQAWVGHCPWWR